MPRLQNKTALITGGARGIGAAIARAFHDEGATVILTDKDVALGQATARDIGAVFAKLDVRSEPIPTNLIRCSESRLARNRSRRFYRF